VCAVLCVCAYVRAYVRACVRLCVRVCVRVCVGAFDCVCGGWTAMSGTVVLSFQLSFVRMCGVRV